jgi:hypothetical protein
LPHLPVGLLGAADERAARHPRVSDVPRLRMPHAAPRPLVPLPGMWKRAGDWVAARIVIN